MASRDTNFLFWNTHKNAVDEQIVRLVNYEEVDVLALAESAYTNNALGLMTLINSRIPEGSGVFHCAPFPQLLQHQKVQVFSRLQRPQWNVEFSRNRYTGWSFRTNHGLQLLMVGAHFPSVQNDQGDEQRQTAIELRLDIRSFEEQWQEEHPLGSPLPLAFIIGDFNASPFDAGIAGFYGLNASNNRDVVSSQGNRVLNGRSSRFMYNPMWRFLGNVTTPGTYHERLSSPVCYDWYVLDQVLLSPALIPHFNENSLRILTWDAGEQFGGERLTTRDNGIPISTISDHLPIVFQLNSF